MTLESSRNDACQPESVEQTFESFGDYDCDEAEQYVVKWFHGKNVVNADYAARRLNVCPLSACNRA